MNTSIRELYLRGDSAKAAELRTQQFSSIFPRKSVEILEERNTILAQSRYLKLFTELEHVKNSLPLNIESESRIKSIASIHDSMNIDSFQETTVGGVRDLVGYRYWIECERLEQFPGRMISLVVSLLKTTTFLQELEYIQMIDMNNNPHQKVTLLFRINKVFVEVQIKNLMLKSAFSRTLYPMWESHIKNRFNQQSIPFCFDNNQRLNLWNIVCIANSDRTIQLPFKFDQCACLDECELRKQGEMIDSKVFHHSMREIANQFGKKLIIV